MKLTKDDVVYVAELARLEFNDDELKVFSDQLTSILDYAEKLNELDTSNIMPTAHVLPVNNVLREDVVTPSLDREKVLQNAPDQQNGCFKVPKVIE